MPKVECKGNTPSARYEPLCPDSSGATYSIFPRPATPRNCGQQSEKQILESRHKSPILCTRKVPS